MAATVDPVSVDANWRQRLKTEERSAKSAEGEWGFMAGKTDLAAATHRSHATSPAKYYGGSGGWTVRHKNLPQLDSEQQQPEPEEEVPDVASPTGHRTARAAALLSHSMRLEAIHNSNVSFTTSSKCYGSRLPIEQFGVAQHGLQATQITKQNLPS